MPAGCMVQPSPTVVIATATMTIARLPLAGVDPSALADGSLSSPKAIQQIGVCAP